MLKGAYPMTGITPNWDYWRERPSIEIWEIAVLMHGFDPRAMTDILVRNPYDPTDPHGVPLDCSEEEKTLISTVNSSKLLSAPAIITAADRNTQVLVASLVPWLHERGLCDLASELEPSHGGAPTTPACVADSQHRPADAVVAKSPTTKSRRRDTLAPVIERAQRQSLDKNDTAQVWAQLQAMADDAQAPLISSTKEGVKYHRAGADALFKREDLRKRLKRSQI
jgi:hypothetical protein